jgi:hydroxyacylglutathione hydrolase
MREVAADVWLLDGFPPYGINVYLAGDVLIDAATRLARRRVIAQLEGHRLSAHALTHVHPDHQGASRAVCERFGVPLWCGERDAHAMETGDWSTQQDPSLVAHLQWRCWAGPPHPVARRLREGDEVAGFQMIETPGHSPGHVALWRAGDRTLIAGDVLTNIDTVTGVRGLHEPRPVFTPDPVRNRASARRLADLEPAVVLFGHGPPLRDPRRWREFIDDLPEP